MNIETLQLFRDVAARLNFAVVAEDYGINPSSVSRTIALLEQDLGVRLFNRTTRRMTLTESGSSFLRRVMIILDELEEAREEVHSTTISPVGTLRMTASVTFGERIIMPLISAFRETYPAVKLELIFTDANLDYVAEGIDLGIRLGAELKGDLVATKLFDTRYHVYASPYYLQSHATLKRPEDITQHSCVLFSLAAFRSSSIFLDQDGDETSVAISGDVATASALNLRTAALSGMGPALLPDWLARDDCSEGKLVNLFPKYRVTATKFNTAAWLLYPSKAYLPLKVRSMIDFLKANAVGA